MRTTSNLSTIVVALIGTMLFLNATFAQTSNPPTFVPSGNSGLKPVQDAKPAVPSILGGSLAPVQTPTPLPPTPQPAAPKSEQEGSAPAVQPGGFIPAQRPQTNEPAANGAIPGSTGSGFQPQEPQPQEPQPPSQSVEQQPGNPDKQPQESASTAQPQDTSQPVRPAMAEGTQDRMARVPQPVMSSPANGLRGGVRPVAGQAGEGFEGGQVSASTLAITSGPIGTETPPEFNELNTEGPKLRITSDSPSEIALGKSAEFVIYVENLEQRRAENVIVGIDFPAFVEITTSLPSTGTRKTTDGQEQPRLMWEIPIVESSTTEKIVIEVTPREAKAFDVNVDWTFRPIRGRTTINVTQAELLVQMSGPTEVLYGETALYHVTVSNPGNGTAENVVVMLPEVLGGERASLGNIPAGDEKVFQVELIARTAGPMELTTTATADNDVTESDSREIVVRRANLEMRIEGPPMKYAGSNATYQLTVTNTGDAMAKDVVAAVALPVGASYVSGIDGAELMENGIRWNVGMLSPGNHRTWQLSCNLASAGELAIEAATRGAGELAATDKITTRVEAVADLVLAVTDPKGPLPTGEQIPYQITIRNRGTRSAIDVDVVMHFSEGIEPIEAAGIASELAPGQVTFATIPRIDPGQEVSLKVTAIANKAGAHRFRAQCLCEESDSHEVAEGTTKFFGDSQPTAPRNAVAPEEETTGFRR